MSISMARVDGALVQVIRQAGLHWSQSCLSRLVVGKYLLLILIWNIDTGYGYIADEADD